MTGPLDGPAADVPDSPQPPLEDTAPERARSLREEQRKTAAAQEKLDALRAAGVTRIFAEKISTSL